MDYSAVYLALAVCSGIGLLITLIAIPLVRGSIKRNNWYGFRTPKTLSSDEVWYPANRTAAINLIAASIFILITAALLFFLKGSLPPKTTVILMAVVTFLAILAAVVKSFLALRKL